MRSFNCSWYYHDKNNNIVSRKDSACWANISHNFDNHDIYKEYKILDGIIYIFDYEEDSTKKYIPLLVKTINEITPCEIVTFENQECISFKLLSNYNNSLILLNFIRNLWHEPYQGYSLKFFEELEKLDDEDPLVRLTLANKEACVFCKTAYGPGHSNVQNQNNLKIKTVDDLLKAECPTAVFLTT